MNVQNYRYQVKLECFCYVRGSYEVTVQNGEAALLTELGEPVNPGAQQELFSFSTVERMFQRMETPGFGQEVGATYDPALGFPNQIRLTVYGAADSEATVTISEFKVLP